MNPELNPSPWMFRTNRSCFSLYPPGWGLFRLCYAWSENGTPKKMSLDGSRVYEWSEFREQEFNRQIKEHASTWPAVSVVDWNGDGDDDVMIATDYLYFGFVERSYLEHGYAFGY